LFILAGMPVAVNAVILAEKFNASPKFVSKCILWTTLISFIVLPFMIGFVK
jgi:predicted permease